MSANVYYYNRTNVTTLKASKTSLFVMQVQFHRDIKFCFICLQFGRQDASVAKPSAHTDAGLPSLSCVGTPRVALEECMLTVKIRQPSHEFTFGVGMTFVSYPLVLTPVV
jgi:hypothetical protein